jgi:hypothetical protein
MDQRIWQAWYKARGQAELRAIVMRVWDPVGVSDEPQAAGEYDAYLGPIARYLRDGWSAERLAGYLTALASVHIGMGDDFDSATASASTLISWHETEMALASSEPGWGLGIDPATGESVSGWTPTDELLLRPGGYHRVLRDQMPYRRRATGTLNLETATTKVQAIVWDLPDPERSASVDPREPSAADLATRIPDRRFTDPKAFLEVLAAKIDAGRG